jgi:hypothetical protein
MFAVIHYRVPRSATLKGKPYRFFDSVHSVHYAQNDTGIQKMSP